MSFGRAKPLSRAKSSFRVEDGILIAEIEELALHGTDRVPSEDDETLVNLPSPEEFIDEEELTSADSFSTQEFDVQDFPALCKESKYKDPLSEENIKEIMKVPKNQDESGGLIWNAKIVPDDFDETFKKNGKLKMCGKNNYDANNGCIKPRRGNLLVKNSDFFGSIVKYTDGDDFDDFELYTKSPRWVFSGVLCGWPGLRTLEVRKIEYKRALSVNWKTHWDADENSALKDPSFPETMGVTEVRAVLRAPGWSQIGWSKESPGYLFWFENGAVETPTVTYGTDIVRKFENHRIKNDQPSKCVRIHMVSHRYATGNSRQIRDRLTYHSFGLLEWDHGEYCTVVEVGYRGGIGGYLGRANWIEDKMDTPNSLYKALPPEMVHPWKENLSEIRAFDVTAKNLDEHLKFMECYTGKHERFIDVQVTFSHDVRLTFCNKEHIAQYLVNYISRAKTYSEMRRNCQTFAADFCALLAGKKDVQPYHPINRFQYHNQTHYFIYEPLMY